MKRFTIPIDTDVEESDSLRTALRKRAANALLALVFVILPALFTTAVWNRALPAYELSYFALIAIALLALGIFRCGVALDISFGSGGSGGDNQFGLVIIDEDEAVNNDVWNGFPAVNLDEIKVDIDLTGEPAAF